MKTKKRPLFTLQICPVCKGDLFHPRKTDTSGSRQVCDFCMGNGLAYVKNVPKRRHNKN